MARTKFKWKFTFFAYLIVVNVCIKSFPISTKLPSLTTTDTVFQNGAFPNIEEAVTDFRSRVAAIFPPEEKAQETAITTPPTEDDSTKALEKNSTDVNVTRNTVLRNIRPGQEIRQYAIELTINGNSFTGRAVIDVVLAFEDREDPILLHAEDLEIQSVLAGVFTDANARPADFNVDDGVLEIEPDQTASSYILIIEYSGSLLTTPGQGFYRGSYNDFTYLAMNLHPTNARRVFPCMDEPTEASIISFTFNGIDQNNLISNSLLEENSATQFRALMGPPHLWSMAAHNLNNVNVPTSGVLLYIRPGVASQDSQASIALNYYYLTLNEWTEKPYFEIVLNQANQLSILSLPDVSRDWYGLGTIAIWEPYILMETTCSVKQRFTAFSKMAEQMSKQWFGQVIYPENWRYDWVVSGLASYAAYDVLKTFQESALSTDITLLDVNTLFVTEVIQESLYRDGYSSTLPLELPANIFDEDVIRDYMHGIQKVKAPALFWMLRLILDNEEDYIKHAGRALIASRSLQTVETLHFIDAINSGFMGNGFIDRDEVDDYLEPYLLNNGCPLIYVGIRQGGVLVTQERFTLNNQQHVNYGVPITYSVSHSPNFDNVEPIEMLEGTEPFNMLLDEEEGDYVLFNVQGQGYYRVNYDNALWERITEALEDPDSREEIHPLNRATLIDDSLNLARSGRITYETAFLVVLTMEHEIEYAPWRAFIRNMNFLKKRLEALVDDDEDLDPDIYLRMVRRSIVAFEREIGFDPDPLITEPAMTSLTRGMVMDHACRAGYQPCIAAAVDWFYDPNANEPTVNPNIPSDLRPAVYCAVMREGGADVLNALTARLEIEVSMWERVVILESLACSRDNDYISTLLEETIVAGIPYSTEERLKIFIAVAESNYQNARAAMNFISRRTNEIRNMYGGSEKLEEAIHALAANMADDDLASEFYIWVDSQTNTLDDSQLTAERAAELVMENLQWDNRYMDIVYEWIDENDAPTLVASLVLISISFMITLFNH